MKKNILKLGFKDPTPIQVQCIPKILEGRDVIGIAQTGTGKTAAFGLPLLQLVMSGNKDKSLKALILSPTRELAVQITENLVSYSEGVGVSILSVTGGVEIGLQVGKLKEGVTILVATPGRLLDLLEKKLVRLSAIEFFVLDEADRMLDMGFSEELQKIVNHLPKVRQTLLFTATMSREVEVLGERFLKNPKLLRIENKTVSVEKIKQQVYHCEPHHKFELLKKILKTEAKERVIIFTKTKVTSDKIKEFLSSQRLAAMVFHGDKDQQERQRALSTFKEGSVRILIATDLAARGLDVEGVRHVINFELPLESETYLHRIGRTARAGESGEAISFCSERERPQLLAIEALLKMALPSENYVGSSSGLKEWIKNPPVIKTSLPTPGKNQEKSRYLDHSKRQKLSSSGESSAKNHPGFKKKKRKK